MSVIELGSVGPSVQASARADGWWLGATTPGADLATRAGWPIPALQSTGGVSAVLQVEALIDLELAEARGGAIVLPWERFGELFKGDAPTLPLKWTEFSSFNLVINTVSEVGRSDFRYLWEFHLGDRAVPCDRAGYFIRRRATGEVFHLDERTYAAVSAMDEFNSLSPDGRKENGWLTFATVRNCADAIGATVDRYLASNEVVVPSSITATPRSDEGRGSIFLPTGPDLPPDFGDAFLRNSEVPSVYALDRPESKRVRLVFTERQRDVLRRMKGTAVLKGEDREKAKADPAGCFDGLLDAVEVKYGPRVIGVGAFTPRPTPANPGASGRFLESPTVSDSPSGVRFEQPSEPTSTEILLPGGDGCGDLRLAFRNEAELIAARNQMQAAIAERTGMVMINGRSVAVSNEALASLSQSPARSDSVVETGPPGRRFLLVYTNETETLAADQHAASEASKAVDLGQPLSLPSAILPGVSLKPHQIEGIKWLACCGSQKPHRRGILLADDMGLGKTRQILMYLARLIEDGVLQAGATDGPTPPWRPILIVAPLMLVEDETWQKEIKQCFANDGDLFGPILSLHGAGIDRVRSEGVRGRETMVGQPVLDPDKLMQYRTVVTTYETLVSYQHSLAQLKDGRPLWSVMVTDEAQRYKVPNTKVSHAIKAVATDFRIASTGTPVENRLLDLWNIMDALQPALLGDEREFSERWEQPLGSPRAGETLGALRERLLFGRPNAFLIRRTKRELTDLPLKTEEVLPCEMSPAEIQNHIELLTALGRDRRAGGHFSVLHRLAALYQHPSLLRRDSATLSPTALLAESAKLRTVVQKLREISRRGEKALIFARLLDVQQILAQVLEHEFEIPVPIINGSTGQGRGFHSSTSSTARARETRRGILREFRERPGFSVLILSPHVAGIGLTITEANHVFHYGRWWNPAVESQATDRVYRIGQTRPVNVYLPILKDSSGVLSATFDERLHELMTRKTDLARDFLHPSDDETANAEALCDLLASDGAAATEARVNAPLTPAAIQGLDPHDFEAVVAALYAAEGHEVVLTAKAGDGGADVLALRDGTVTLVQAKHSAGRNLADNTGLNDLMGACDIYSSRLGSAIPLRAVLVLNTSVQPKIARDAAALGVTVVPGGELSMRLQKNAIGIGAMAACEARRCASFVEGVKRVRALLGSD